jgi:hypothetical protein
MLEAYQLKNLHRLVSGHDFPNIINMIHIIFSNGMLVAELICPVGKNQGAIDLVCVWDCLKFSGDRQIR